MRPRPGLPTVVTIPKGNSTALADAQLIVSEGRNILAVRLGQSLQSATAAAIAALRHDYPHLHPDEVRALLLPALPADMIEFDTGLPSGRWAPAAASEIGPPARPGLGRRIRTSLAVAGLVALGVAGGWVLAQQHPFAPSAGSRTEASPYTNPQFKAFAAVGRMRCQPLTALRARCTDTDGLVMYSEAAISPDSVVYTFSYGQESIFLRAFRTAGDAAAWGHEQGIIDAYPNLTVHDRFALWGSDPERIGVYLRLLKSAPPSTTPESTTMPDRLAEIALGTLLAEPTAGASTALTGETLVAVELVMGGPQAGPSAPAAPDPDSMLVLALLVPPSPSATPAPEPSASESTGPGSAPKANPPGPLLPAAPPSGVPTSAAPTPVSTPPAAPDPSPDPTPLQPDTPLENTVGVPAGAGGPSPSEPPSPSPPGTS